MSIIGYARVSSVGQSLEVQVEQLRAAGCEKVFSETRSGTSASGRLELQAMLDWVRSGDVATVCRLDRISRSVTDLRTIIDRLEAKGVGFRCLQQPIDTTSSSGRLMLNMLGAFAEFETDLRRERQAEGIAKAKTKGLYRGRPPKINENEVVKLKSEGMGASEIARKLGIARASVYRLLS